MSRLITGLLDLAQVQEGRLVMQQHPCDVQALVDETLESQRETAAPKAIRMIADLPDPRLWVWADGLRSAQVLTNLVENAIKFTPERGQVTVSVAADGEMVRFQVRDTGPGIAAEALPHLFERFWRAQQSDAVGTGLGLAIAKGIVEAHGGRIWVESTPGNGATFIYTLPRYQGQVDRQAKLA
jgi:signal transduction histidine kinase